MELYGSLTSPYVRLCRVVAALRGLDLPLVQANPYEDEGLRAVNPLGRVPALRLDDGLALTDSGAIIRYLDERGEGASLYERGGTARHETDAHVSLAMGVLDLGVAWFMEQNKRSGGERSAWWQQRRLDGAAAGLAAMDEAARGLPEDAGLTGPAFAVTCDWLAFRMPQVDWRRHEALAALVDAQLAEPALAETDPRRA